jgi:hypothetical protein
VIAGLIEAFMAVAPLIQRLWRRPGLHIGQREGLSG